MKLTRPESKGTDLLLAIMNGTNVSRNMLVRKAGFSFPSVTRIVERFIRDGVVVEGARVQVRGRTGPKPTALAVRADFGCSVGVDVEGLAVRAVLLDFGNNVLRSRRIELDPAGDLDAVYEAARSAVADTLGDAAVPKESLLGLGLGLPGYVDPLNGSTSDAMSFRGFERMSFKQRVADEFGLPVWVEKNVRCAALAESRIGPHAARKNMAVVLARFGVGCAVVLDGGGLLDTGGGRGGELGHTIVVANGRKCICRRRGCLEAYAGGWALAGKMARRQERKERTPMLYRRLVEASKQGDGDVRELLLEGCRYLGIGVRNLVRLLGCEFVLVQGIYGFLGEAGREIIEEAVAGPGEPAVGVSLDGMGEFSGAVGAAMAARDRGAYDYFGERIFEARRRGKAKQER